MAGEDFPDETQAAYIECPTTIWIDPGRGEVSIAPQQGDQLAAGRIGVGVIHRS